MSKELRDLLKPPFSIRPTIFNDGRYIICDYSGERNIVELRGSGVAIGNDIIDFITTALNNQWERDFHTEEPLDKRHPHIHCPQCQYPIYKSDFDTDEDGEKKRAQGEKSINDYFVEQAKAFLTDAQYNSIYMLATQEKMTAEEA